MKRALILAFVLSWATPSLAAPITITTFADFGAGPLGALGSYATVIDGVQVYGIGEGQPQLYRFNDPAEDCGGACTPHYDRGLGVLSTGEVENPAEPELNLGEYLVLAKPFDWQWTDVRFTSVNNNAEFSVYFSPFPAGGLVGTPGGTRQDFASGSGIFGATTFASVSVPTEFQWQPYIWIVPKGATVDNFFLVEGVGISQTSDDPTPVPSPAEWSLLATGLGALWYRRRKRIS